MKTLGRDVLGVLAGAVTGIVLVSVSDLVGEMLFPLPPGVDPRDPAALSAAMEEMPLGAILLLLAGWSVATFAGAWTAARIGSSPVRNALLAGGVLLAGAVLTALAVPPPVWFWAAWLVLFAPCAYLGGWVVSRKPEPDAERLAA